MGNPLKGQVSFTGSDGVEHKLCFTAEAMFRLEEAIGKPMASIEADMRDTTKFGLGTIRTMFWAALLDTNPDLELKNVGAIFSKIGPLEACDLVVKAFTGAFDGIAEAAPASPPEPGQTP